MLDDLVGVIETLKTRIQDHGLALQSNETRTRMALVDPLLQALGWDTADPSLVTPEYSVAGRADYALLLPGGKPAAFIEAKRLGEHLIDHREQMTRYANMEGVQYGGLTNGDRWELYRIFDPVPLEQRRILDVSIANDPAHRTALRLLLLWRPNLASEQPVPAGEPISSATVQPLSTDMASDAVGPLPQPGPSDLGPEWTLLSDFVAVPRTKPPSTIRFPDGAQRANKSWQGFLENTTKWLCERGLLTIDNVPVVVSEKRYIVNTTPLHPSGKDFFAPVLISGTELFLERNVGARGAIGNAKRLLAHCNQDASQVYLKMDS